MTADQLLEIARRDRPNVRYTKNARETAIAAWNGERWACVAGKLITGEWVNMPDLLVNGKPAIADWVD